MRLLKVILVLAICSGLAANDGPTAEQGKVKQLVKRAESAREKGDYHRAAKILAQAYEQAESDADRHEIAVLTGFTYAGLVALRSHARHEDEASAAYDEASAWFAQALETAPGEREFLGMATVWMLDFETAQRLIVEFVQQHPGDKRAEIGQRVLANWNSISTVTKLAGLHGDQFRLPVKIEAAAPVYTELARRKRLQGSVELQLVLDETGRPAHIFTEEGLPYGLTERAIRAILTWNMEPATVNGNPVPVSYPVTINFAIN